MGKTRRRSSSSSSSSSEHDSYRRRRRCRRLESERGLTPPGTSELQPRLTTPSSAQTEGRVQYLEQLVNSLMAKLAGPTVTGHAKIKPECVPEFLPGNPSLTSTKWLDKIEQLGTINGWDDATKIFVMQTRFAGIARKWYDNLTSYQHSWEEWKELVVVTFPDHQDYAMTLRKMLNYQKGKHETWEQYYFKKMEFIQGCKIVGREAVSCIIDGITDPTIQTGARAGRYRNPETLYAEYLSTLQSYSQSTSNDSNVRPGGKPNSRTPFPRHNTITDRKSFRCYNCGERGHSWNKCPRPKLQCAKCNRLGHLTKNCRQDNSTAKAHHTESGQRKHHDKYFFNCEVNGMETRAYIDTGCGPVIIREADAKRLNLQWKPCTMSIKGYAGGTARVLGSTNIKLKVDQAEQDVNAIVVPDHTQQIPVMIGQEFLNKKGNALLVKEGQVRVMASHNIPVDMDALPRKKVAVWAKEATVVPPGTVAFLTVRTEDENCSNDYYIEGGFRGQPEHEWCVERCITKDGGAVCVANVSSQPLTISQDMVIARAVLCQPENLDLGVSVFYSNISAQQSFTLTDIHGLYNSSLSDKEVELLLDLLNNYRDCFSLCTEELGKTNVATMAINLTDESPVVYRPYRL